MYIQRLAQNLTYTHYTYLQDLLNTVDGWGEQSADLLVIVDVVCVSQTHEQDVGRQTWDQIHGYAARLQLWRRTSSETCNHSYKASLSTDGLMISDCRKHQLLTLPCIVIHFKTYCDFMDFSPSILIFLLRNGSFKDVLRKPKCFF